MENLCLDFYQCSKCIDLLLIGKFGAGLTQCAKKIKLKSCDRDLVSFWVLEERVLLFLRKFVIKVRGADALKQSARVRFWCRSIPRNRAAYSASTDRNLGQHVNVGERSPRRCAGRNQRGDRPQGEGGNLLVPTKLSREADYTIGMSAAVAGLHIDAQMPALQENSDIRTSVRFNRSKRTSSPNRPASAQ
jgi:hypothetical protein